MLHNYIRSETDFFLIAMNWNETSPCDKYHILILYFSIAIKKTAIIPKNIDQKKKKRINNDIYINIFFIGMSVRCSQEVGLLEYKLKQSGYKSNLSEG